MRPQSAALGKAVAARRAGQLHEALQHRNAALALCGADEGDERADGLRELGELARANHDLPAAQVHYEEAVRLLRTSEDRLKLAHTVRHLGDVHAAQQRWPEAEGCLREALDICRKEPSCATLAVAQLDLANTIRAYAALMSETARREQARSLWTEAGSFYQALGIAAGVAECRRRAAEPA